MVCLESHQICTIDSWQASRSQTFHVLKPSVKGKYGPVFVGKTWFGKYDDKGEFTAHDPDKIIDYYFLDFNEAAVKEQRQHHLDGSEEELLDPIPHIDN
jgi:hypothetical protein